MSAGLNIKNAQTYRLVRELAEATGESLTEAVTEAVRERLERVRRQEAARSGMAAEILSIAREMHARLPDDFFDIDHSDLLYDENGLPK